MNNSYTCAPWRKTILDNYSEYLQTLGFSSHTVKSHPQMLRYFLLYLDAQGVNQINNITPKHITDYFDHLETRSNLRTRGKALSKAHLNKNFDAVDKFLEFLHHVGHTAAPSPTGYRLAETRQELADKVKALTVQQVNQLYKSCENLFPQLSFNQAQPRRALAVVMLDLCYACGLRRSEAFKLLIKDVDFDKKLLFIRQAKGNKDRFVPMSDTITKRLKEFIYHYRKDFSTSNNRVFPLSFHSLPYYFKTVLRCSGLGLDTGTGLHILRHSIATHLLQNGMSVEQIGKFLGHATLESTQVYTHLIQEND